MTSIAILEDDRGVSTTVSFVLATGMSVLLVAGLLMSVGAVMESQERRAVDSELRTVAEGLAVDVESVARLSDDLDSDERLAMRVEAPTAVAGEPYSVSIEHDAGPTLTVDADDRSHTVELIGVGDVEAGSISGGTVWIVGDADGVRLQEARP